MTTHFDHPCRCGHERKWHDACSLCPCAFYLPEGEKTPTLLKHWNAARAQRKRREQA